LVAVIERKYEQLVGVADVAEYLQMSKSFINKSVLYSDIPVHRIGRSLRFRLSEIDQWVEGGARGLA
jgi:excisionase family DNA binding protein